MEGAAVDSHAAPSGVVGPADQHPQQGPPPHPPVPGQVGGVGVDDPHKVVAQEEEKLKSRFPTAVRPGGSLFLQKKLLQRGQKYFDSGDYNMARGQGAKTGPIPKLHGKTITGEKLAVPNVPTGVSHPSPDVIPHRKSSISTSKLASGTSPTMPAGFPGSAAIGAPVPPPAYD